MNEDPTDLDDFPEEKLLLPAAGRYQRQLLRTPVVKEAFDIRARADITYNPPLTVSGS